MRCIVDAQLPRHLSNFLNKTGWDAIHTLDLPHANQTPDSDIRFLADEQGRIVFTKDADFVRDHILSGSPQKILYIKTGNIGNQELIKLVAKHLPDLAKLFMEHHWIELGRNSVIVH